MPVNSAPTGHRGDNEKPAKKEDTRDATQEDRPEDGEQKEDAVDDGEPVRFSPEEEASLVAETNSHKADANAFFARSQPEAALTAYETAVSILPNYLYYDLAVLRSNMAACHLKLSAWKEAIRSATEALDALDKEEKKAEREKKAEEAKRAAEENEEEEVEEEIISEGAAKAAKPPSSPPAKPSSPTAEDRLRIRAKALLRRGRARSELGGWANLAGAEEDYKALAALPSGTLGDVDRRFVQKQLRDLPGRTSAAKEQEMGEMMGKLKELGNGLLRPFGISTDNFQMVKDEKTGGYSMNFRQNPGK